MTDEDVMEKIGLPCFIKPSLGGSSFGVTKVEHEGDAAELAAAVSKRPTMIGVCSWNRASTRAKSNAPCSARRPARRPQASWPGEIVLDKRAEGDDQFYDFDSKYVNSDASHVEVPASLPEETLNRVRETAKKAFIAVDGAA